MKKYFIYITILLAFIYSGCDKPGPTELVEDSNSTDILEVEIIGKDLDNDYYSNGFDTSGVMEDARNYTNLISVSGIKLTKGGITNRISSAQAILFDRTKPFRSPNGTLLGYNTITPGIISFDNVTARLTNYKVRYRESNMMIDTVLGKKYELFNINGKAFYDPFIFHYNSSINLSYNPFVGGQQSSFEIITPKEITGSVKIVKSNNRNNFRVELNWTGELVDKFSVIIGGVRTKNQQVFPFYRIKTNDDGNLIIPSSLLQNIPRDRFNKISISLVRKYDKIIFLMNNELYVVSQSIHTIIIELP